MDERHKVFSSIAFVYMMMAINDSASLRVQRRWFHRLRRSLATGLQLPKLESFLDEEDQNQVGPSWRLLPLAFLHVMVIQALSHVYEGRLYITMNILGVGSILGIAAIFGSHRTMVWLGRLAFLQQFFVLYNVQITSGMDRTMVIRAIFTRSLAAISLSERLDETFVQCVAFAWLFSLNTSLDANLYTLPIRVWFLLILPFFALGIRDWVCHSTVLAGYSPVKITVHLMASVSLPIMMMLMSPLGLSVSQSSAWSKYVEMSSLGNILMGATIFYYGESVDNLIMQTTLTKQRNFATGSEHPDDHSMIIQERVTRTVAVFFALTLTAIGSLCTLASLISWMNATAVAGLVSMLGCAMYSFGALKVDKLGDLPASVTMTLFIVHMGLIMMLIVDSFIKDAEIVQESTRAALVVLILSRLMLTIDCQRRFSIMQVESNMFFAVACWAVGTDVDLYRLVIGGSTTCCLMLVLVTLAREHSWRVIKREGDSHAFLFHAIKQKYSAVGSAIEDILDSSLVHSNPDLAIILEDVKKECRKGHDHCHAVNLIRNVRSQRYHGGANAIATKNIRAEIAAWCDKGVLDAAKIKISPAIPANNDSAFELEVHWPVLKAFFVHFSSRKCSIQVDIKEQLNQVVISVESKRCLTQSDTLDIQAVARVLNACAIFQRGFALWIAIKPEGGEDRQKDANEDVFTIPKGLTYAVLDDNALVRLNVKRILERMVSASAKSIFRGESDEECRHFTKEVTELEPDIVLLDENLVGDWKGSQIARILRIQGYTGCIFLHSASNISSDRQLDSNFDAMIEKTSSKDELVGKISAGYRTFLSRRRRQQRGDSEFALDSSAPL